MKKAWPLFLQAIEICCNGQSRGRRSSSVSWNTVFEVKRRGRALGKIKPSLLQRVERKKSAESRGGT